jgi:hypothetical protein
MTITASLWHTRHLCHRLLLKNQSESSIFYEMIIILLDQWLKSTSLTQIKTTGSE